MREIEKIPHIRLGVVGMGDRGRCCVDRMGYLPGVTVTAICDNVEAKVGRARKMLAESGRPAAKEYVGDEAWKALCDDPNVDVVYNTTPWALHAPVQLAAMRAGKHVFTEVPGALTVDECWELVETSERTSRSCMMLENCCYGEVEMLMLNLVKLGMLGEIVHAEGGYIHDLRWMCSTDWPDCECWRFAENRDHGGNRYPTHGLLPLCLALDVNRGDRLDYLVSVDSCRANFQAYMAAKLKPDDPRRLADVKMPDMNITTIRTEKGRTILIQHDVASPRPYTRNLLLSGTKGIVRDYPFRAVLEESVGSGAHRWYDEKKTAEFLERWQHPLWKTLGDLARRIGGHDGMDFVMDARWVYCLQQGIPLDMDVYDLATSSCLCELTEKSAADHSRALEIPDFTRGAWKTKAPIGKIDVDVERMGLDVNQQVRRLAGQQ